MRRSLVRGFQKIGNPGESCVSGPFVIEGAVARKGELGSVERKLAHLTMIKF